MKWPVLHQEDFVFSDECRLNLQNDSRVERVWQIKKEADNPMICHPTVPNALSLMVQGCIGQNGVGRLVVCEHSLNSDYYINIFEHHFIQA